MIEYLCFVGLFRFSSLVACWEFWILLFGYGHLGSIIWFLKSLSRTHCWSYNDVLFFKTVKPLLEIRIWLSLLLSFSYVNSCFFVRVKRLTSKQCPWMWLNKCNWKCRNWVMRSLLEFMDILLCVKGNNARLVLLF